MADKSDTFPFSSKTSEIKTSPPPRSTSVYKKKPITYGQMGKATAYSSNGETFSSYVKPHYYQLATWDSARKKEPIIKDSIEKIVLSIIAKIGTYNHPDPTITAFVRANIDQHLKRWIYDLAKSMCWSGFGTSEIIPERKIGPDGISQVWIEDVVNYHPSQVDLKLNLFGRLTHGESLPTSQFKTGVWVPTPDFNITEKNSRLYADVLGNQVRLPKSRVIHATFNSEGNNPWGSSMVESIIEYHLFKEAFRDMMTTALDRYGTPLIYAVVPPQNTEEDIQEPDGSVRKLSLHEVTVRELENMRSESALVFTQIDKEHPIKLDALTTGNNFADAFHSAIEMCDSNMMIGLGIPNLIMKDNRNGLGSGGSSERQVELFHVFISSLFDSVMTAFINQCVVPLILYNFDPRNNPLANQPGYISSRPFRFADIKVLGDLFESLTNVGYLDPTNTEDFNYVRDILDIPTREGEKAKGIPILETQVKVAESNSEALIEIAKVKAKADIETANKDREVQLQIARESHKQAVANKAKQSLPQKVSIR